MGASLSSAYGNIGKENCLVDQCCEDRRSNFRRVKHENSQKKASIQEGNTETTSINEKSVKAFAKSIDGSAKKLSRVPSWQQAPAPMQDWTAREQQVLIDELEANPQSRRHHAHRERVFEKTHRLLPEKTMEQIEQCYQHLQSKRIAYFGKSDIKEGTNALPPRGPSRRSFDDFPNIGDPQRSSKDVRHSLS